VRDREWAFIIDTIKQDAVPELFHSSQDPYESTDVASDYPEIVADRRSQLENFLGGSLPFSYVHEPDTHEMATLRRHLQIRDQLGIKTGLGDE
jgi:hypothetical protein